MPVRKIPKNYRNITGMAAHSKSVGCAAYESSLERDFLSLLEFCPDVIRFEVQPVSIEWFDDSGKKHMYTPDVLVHYKPSRQPVTIILYEVKYRSDLRKNWSVLQPKFKVARAFCRQKGWMFKLVTEVEIHTVYLQNVRFLLPYMRNAVVHEYYEPYMILLDQKLKELKTATPRELVAAVFQDEWNQAKILPVLWYLVAVGEIGADLNLPLTMNSTLWRKR